jgi:hypothetical protein
MTEFDDYDEPFDPDNEFDDDFEEGPEDGGVDGENGEENKEKAVRRTFQSRKVETDPLKEVLGECVYCGRTVTRGLLESYDGAGENGWEAYGACPDCQAWVFNTYF